jgi:PAS domain S-box-containing protein
MPSPSALRALYIEDSSVDADLARRALAKHAPHIQVTAVSEARAALELLPTDPAAPSPFDVLLLDYRLPGMDGLELAKILREERGLDLPIVLITGQGSEEVAARALHMGIDDYLAKHEGYLFEVAAVLEKVQRQAELRREREVLRATSTRLGFLIESSPTILYSLDCLDEGPRISWVSENISRLLGLPPERLLEPQGWLEKILPEDREAYLTWQAALRHETEGALEYRVLTADRQLRWVRDAVRIMRDDEGRPREGIGAWIDFTDRHRDEAVREARNAMLDQVLRERPLEEILTTLAHALEALLPGA